MYKESANKPSASALKLTQNLPNRMQSFINIHKECNRALPEQMIMYKRSIQFVQSKLARNRMVCIKFSTINYIKANNFLNFKNKPKMSW